MKSNIKVLLRTALTISTITLSLFSYNTSYAYTYADYDEDDYYQLERTYLSCFYEGKEGTLLIDQGTRTFVYTRYRKKAKTAIGSFFDSFTSGRSGFSNGYNSFAIGLSSNNQETYNAFVVNPHGDTYSFTDCTPMNDETDLFLSNYKYF